MKETTQKNSANTEDAKKNELDIQEISGDELCDVAGGNCGGCTSCSATGCGGACAVQPALNQL